MGEAVSPSQTVEGQNSKLQGMAKEAPTSVKVQTYASKFAKGTGRLVPALGAAAIGARLATDPNYRVDEGFADFFGISGAE